MSHRSVCEGVSVGACEYEWLTGVCVVMSQWEYVNRSVSPECVRSVWECVNRGVSPECVRSVSVGVCE